MVSDKLYQSNIMAFADFYKMCHLLKLLLTLLSNNTNPEHFFPTVCKMSYITVSVICCQTCAMNNLIMFVLLPRHSS